MLTCFLGVHLFCFFTARSQSTYAFTGRNGQIVQQKSLENTGKTDETVQKQTLFTVLKELNKTKGVYFLFSDHSLGSKLVNPVEGNAANVEKILEQVLKNTGLKFKKINEKTFVILPRQGDGSVIDSGAADLAQNLYGMAIPDESANAIPYETITGKVTTGDGAPISGVSVTVKGSKRGTSTNASGVFSIEANRGDVLVFSYVGYATREASVGENMQISLVESNKQLNEVVVTALGVQRKSKDLTYATQKLSNADLTTVKDANFVNSLSGKVAGVTITRSASGLGGSARVVLRGNKSTVSNQPLYVIDGIPLANFTPSQPADVWGQSASNVNPSNQPPGAGGRDGGDGISNLNPDDIESVTILKGASGAALYGSQAANGAIVITTKSGKSGKTRISISSDITAESPLYQPKLQFKYGQTGLNAPKYDSTAEGSWGPAINAPDNTKGFFRTGLTTTNSVSLAGGTERAQTYFSYGNTHSLGIEPTSSFNKNTFNFRETAKFLDDRLTVDANISFLDQSAKNRPLSGLYGNPLTGLYSFPRGLNFSYYKQNFEYASPLRNGLMTQNWYDINYDKAMTGQDHEQNPYWLLYRNPRKDSRSRGYGNITLKYKLNDWLNIQARGNFDKSFDTYDSRMYAGTQSVQAASNGRYTLDKATNTQLYGDLLLTANKDLSRDLNLSATLGSSITDYKTEDLSFDTDPTVGTGLAYANKFGVNFINSASMIANQDEFHKQQQAVFANAQLGYKNFLYLDLTGRNDWSSTFAFTPTKNKGYFYYSAGLNLILSDAFTLAEPVSFAKVRISYAKVGNDVATFATNPAQWNKGGNINNNNGGAAFNTIVPYPGTFLKPEDNRSFEAGTEWRFFHDRVGIDVTYYKNNNYRQYVTVNAPLGSGYSKYYLNLGNIQNQGIEAVVYVTPVSTRKLKWTSTVNFSLNRNKVVKLSDPSIAGANSTNPLILTGAGVNMYQSEIIEGGQWGDIYGYTFQRDSKTGSIIVDSTGAPQKNATLSKVGNPNPDYSVGWNNSVDIGQFSLSVLVDGRFGGKVMSVTQAVLDGIGASKVTGDARDAGGVSIKAINNNTGQAWSGKINAQTFYTGVGGRAGISEYYMYSATAIRLRELAIGYRIPLHVKGITDMKFSLIGRNLFFFSKKAPFDPEISMATNNALQGIETFGIPSTRSLGASLKLSF